ncbi:MAG: TldD/PmbA family protein [Actinobacteria bacterium]|nr:TldD/PmbA family protein [Actinomycetota bacterium]
MISEGVIKKVLNICHKAGADFSEIFVEEKETNSLRLEDSRIERASSGLDRGYGIRARFGDNTLYSFSNDFKERSIIDAANALVSSVNGYRRITTLDLRKKDVRSAINTSTFLPEDVDWQEKVNYLLDSDRVAREYSSEIMQLGVVYGDEIQRVLIANSEGTYAFDERIRTRFVAQAIAKRGDKVQTGYVPVAALKGLELLREKNPADIALKAAQIAVRMLDSIPAPAGKMDVVIEKGHGGTMFHEACGHGLEGDTVAKNSSVYTGKMGKKVASDNITLVDDGTLEGQWGSFGFDDEGYPAKKNILIEDGILVGYMYDEYYSGKSGVPQTGNGRRESYMHIPIPRMTNTYILPGIEDPQNIIKETLKGVYARFLAGGQVDPATGDFVFGIGEGYLIENGKLTYPIRGATIIGNGPQVLFSIDIISNDLDFLSGVCGKDGQGVPVNDGCPTIRIKDMTMGGTEVMS